MGDEKDVLNGLVGLSSKIAKAHESGQLTSVEEGDVVHYLKKKLKWKVASANVEVPVANVPEFSIQVFSHLETVPTRDGEFPAIISTKNYPEITGA